MTRDASTKRPHEGPKSQPAVWSMSRRGWTRLAAAFVVAPLVAAAGSALRGHPPVVAGVTVPQALSALLAAAAAMAARWWRRGSWLDRGVAGAR